MRHTRKRAPRPKKKTYRLVKGMLKTAVLLLVFGCGETHRDRELQSFTNQLKTLNEVNTSSLSPAEIQNWQETGRGIRARIEQLRAK